MLHPVPLSKSSAGSPGRRYPRLALRIFNRINRCTAVRALVQMQCAVCVCVIRAGWSARKGKVARCCQIGSGYVGACMCTCNCLQFVEMRLMGTLTKGERPPPALCVRRVYVSGMEEVKITEDGMKILENYKFKCG